MKLLPILLLLLLCLVFGCFDDDAGSVPTDSELFVMTWVDDNNNIRTIQSRDLSASNWGSLQTVNGTTTNKEPGISFGDDSWCLLTVNSQQVLVVAEAPHLTSGALQWPTPRPLRSFSGGLVTTNIKPLVTFNPDDGRWTLLFKQITGLKVGFLNPGSNQVVEESRINFAGLTNQPILTDESSLDYYSGVFHLAFKTTLNGIQGIYYSTSNDAINWERPRLVRRGGPGFPVLKTSFSVPIIAAVENAGTGHRIEVFASTNGGNNWQKIGNTLTGTVSAPQQREGIALAIGSGQGLGFCKVLTAGQVNGTMQAYESFEESLCKSNMTSINFNNTTLFPSTVTNGGISAGPVLAFGK